MLKEMNMRKWLIGAGLIAVTLIVALLIFVTVTKEEQGSEDQRAMILSLYDHENVSVKWSDSGRWEIYDTDGELSEYVYFGMGQGYAGPVRVLAFTSPEGLITKVYPYEHEETPSFFALLYQNNFLERVEGLSAPDFDREKLQVDVVSGATVSCEAILTALSRSFSGATVAEGH